ILDFNSIDSVGLEVLPRTLLQLSLEGNLFRKPPQVLKTLKWLKILKPIQAYFKEFGEEPSGEAAKGCDANPPEPHFINICVIVYILLALNIISGHFTEIKFTQWKKVLCPKLYKLQILDLTDNHLSEIPKVLLECKGLRQMILESVRHLNTIPSFNGTKNLEALRIDRAVLLSVPQDLCEALPKLKSLNLHLNEIKNLPNLTMCKTLRLL
ncbi:hypothetical protein Anas_04599, partial [Armadillidium nasatum]